MSNIDTGREIALRLKERAVRHTLHALEEEIREGLTANSIYESLLNGFEVVEDYPNDPRGYSCLLLTWHKDRPVHVVCALHEVMLIIVTVYIPSSKEWKDDFKTRQ
jgi:hypothetical protein